MCMSPQREENQFKSSIGRIKRAALLASAPQEEEQQEDGGQRAEKDEKKQLLLARLGLIIERLLDVCVTLFHMDGRVLDVRLNAVDHLSLIVHDAR